MSTVVYYCHYGDDQYLKMFILSLQTLRDIGGYKGIVRLYTTDPEKAKEMIPTKLDVDIFKVQPTDTPLYDRYRVVKDFVVGNKYIYLDTDTLITRKGISRIFEQIRPKTIHYTGTLEPFSGSSLWHNVSIHLAISKPKAENKAVTTCNSGVFMFDLTLDILEGFRVVVDMGEDIARRNINKVYDIYGDQPIFNTMLRVGEFGTHTEGLILRSNVTLMSEVHNPVIDLAGAIAHYNFGWKGGTDKYRRMEKDHLKLMRMFSNDI